MKKEERESCMLELINSLENELNAILNDDERCKHPIWSKSIFELHTLNGRLRAMKSFLIKKNE